MKKLTLIELNELNVSIIEKYLEAGHNLPNFDKLIKKGVVRSSSETSYDLLEPWIQWVSAHTGLDYDEHKVFRLGDIADSKIPQIFDVLEEAGVSVGAISPMNTYNNLKNPDFFIPDPWTYTPTDGSWASNYIDHALKQAVGDNAQNRVTKQTYVRLLLSLFKLLTFKQIIKLIPILKKSAGKSYRKAIALDYILSYIFINQIKAQKTEFSTLFLNAGAHIQHHYFHNSPFVNIKGCKNPHWYIPENTDPLIEVLRAYDDILGNILSIKGNSLLVATGLTQDPTEELIFYYRLKDHSKFLHDLDLKFSSIKPRMTRDFLVEFENQKDLRNALKTLNSCHIDENQAFQEIEVRENSLFVTLTYSEEIHEHSKLFCFDKVLPIHESVVFVALKNGEHNGNGFILSNDANLLQKFKDGSHIKNLYSTVKTFFS